MSAMSPDEYYQAYKNLQPSAFLPDGTLATVGGVAAKRYVINSDSMKDLPLIQQKIQEVLDAVTSYIAQAKQPKASMKNKDAVVDFKLNGGAFGRAKVGKGSADDLAHVLSAGLLCGKITPKSAADFAANYLGVDCTGFVSTFFLTNGKMSDDPVNIGCGYFHSKAFPAKGVKGRIVWEDEWVRQNDVVVWMTANGKETRSPGHIALVQSAIKTEGSVTFEDKSKPAITTSGWVLDCRESNGSAGEDPRVTSRVLEGIQGTGGERHWRTSGQEKVIVLRPFV